MRRTAALSLAGFALVACATEPLPRAPQSICLIGRFGAPFGKEQVTKQLTARGFDVRVEPSADLAIALIGNHPVNEAGDGFAAVETTAGYRDAVRYGATIVKLSDLADLFGRAGERVR